MWILIFDCEDSPKDGGPTFNHFWYCEVHPSAEVAGLCDHRQ